MNKFILKCKATVLDVLCARVCMHVRIFFGVCECIVNTVSIVSVSELLDRTQTRQVCFCVSSNLGGEPYRDTADREGVLQQRK